jgi:hypothetical protein
MRRFRPFSLRISIALALLTLCIAAGVYRVQAQPQAQIGINTPLPVFVTNPPSAQMLPEGFVSGSRWRFVTWTVPTVMSYTATVNRTSGPWANLTTTGDDGSSTTRWYYIPGMPGSWERQ